MAQQQTTFWSRTKKGSKLGFDKLYTLVDKLGPPVNKLSNKLGAEAFWPTTLDKECDKAARILQSFCKDGFYQEQPKSAEGPEAKQRVLKKIPSQVIRDAKGLAVFTTMRTGLWISGAGGSGIIMSRLPDGSWSPPSGIMLHTAGLGFLAGVDIYDCVLVINTSKAMEAFRRLRCTIGGEVSAVAGPVGAGGILETEVHKRQAPVFTYLKSRGFYAGIQIDGTVMLERNDENERFYSEKLSAQEILTGKVRHVPMECRSLLETVRSAQGEKDLDHNLLPSGPPPSDYEIDDDSQTFGVPSKDDPDPYGVLQLEKEGMLIREAGTHKRASWEQFTFKPSPTSPVFETFEGRRSRDQESISGRLSGRNGSAAVSVGGFDSADASGRVSRASSRTYVTMADSSTQTDDIPPATSSPVPHTSSSPAILPSSPGKDSRRSGSIRSHRPSMDGIPENKSTSSEAPDHKPAMVAPQKPRDAPPRSPPGRGPSPPINAPALALHGEGGHRTAVDATNEQRDGFEVASIDSETLFDDEDGEFSAVVEDPVVVHSVQKATAPQVINKARLVTVPKRVPPTLPERNPNRSRPHDLSRTESEMSSTGASDVDTRSVLQQVGAVDTKASSIYDSETEGAASSGKADHPDHAKDEDTTLEGEAIDNDETIVGDGATGAEPRLASITTQSPEKAPETGSDAEESAAAITASLSPIRSLSPMKAWKSTVEAASGPGYSPPARSRSPRKNGAGAMDSAEEIASPRAATSPSIRSISPRKARMDKEDAVSSRTKAPSLRSLSPSKSELGDKGVTEYGGSPRAAKSPSVRSISPRKTWRGDEDAASTHAKSPSLRSESPKKSGPGKLVIPGAFQSQAALPSEPPKGAL